MKGIENRVVLKIVRVLAAGLWIYATLLLLLPNPQWVLFGLDRLLAYLLSGDAPTHAGSSAHFILFSVISFAIGVSYLFRNMLHTAAALIGYAFLTELIQAIIPYRTFQANDLMQNFIGIVVGLLLATSVIFLVNKLLGRSGSEEGKNAEPTTTR